MADPTNLHAIDDIKFLTGYNVEPVIASETAIHAAIEQLLQRRPLLRRGDGGVRRDGDRVHRRGRRRQPPRAREGERGRAGRPPRQHDAAQRHQEGRERHPHRAVREEAPRPLPHRRRARRGDDAAAQAEERHHRAASRSWRRSTSPSAACRRTGASSSSSARAARWTSASRVLPTHLGREDRHAPPRQGQPAARHDQARLRSEAARRLPVGHPPAVGHGARHRAHRLRQDDDALLGALAS